MKVLLLFKFTNKTKEVIKLKFSFLMDYKYIIKKCKGHFVFKASQDKLHNYDYIP